MNRLGALPMLDRRPDGIYVLPADADRWSQPLGGPFTDGHAARWWIVQYLEERLPEERKAVWADVMRDRMPSRDAGWELGIMDMVMHGRTLEQLAKYLPRDRRHVPDRRRLASGEAA